MLGSPEFGARSPNTVVTAGPWIVRDSYIAEMAIVVDRLTAKIERLERREDMLVKQVTELVEQSQQSTRFEALAESLRNARDYKLEEATRITRELKARIEAFEGPRSEFSGLTHKTFAAIDRKLVEIAGRGLRDEVLMRRLRFTGMAAAVSWIALAGVIAFRAV